eukprot:6550576-Prymnesium_polylepis.1
MASGRGGGVAICFSGSQERAELPDHGESIARNLVRPLRADVLLALSYRPQDNCSTAASCRLAERLSALQPLAAADLQPAATLAELVSTMEGLPHWPAVLRAFNSRRSTLHCERRKQWQDERDGLPYNCSVPTLNSFFAPVLGRNFVLHELRALDHCLGTISAHERRSSRLYERVVHSRLEYVWLAPHPPLALLEPRHVWIPSGEDYYLGYNDRHAVMNRSTADIYFGRWRHILDGEVMRIDRQLNRTRVWNIQR